MTQKAAVLKYMQDNGTITPIEALKHIGSFRLGARIYELKAEKHDIINLNKTGDERYAKYKLVNRQKLPTTQGKKAVKGSMLKPELSFSGVYKLTHSDKRQLINRCRQIQREYPVNHNQYRKIGEQIEGLESRG